jgi:hypothetical protein
MPTSSLYAVSIAELAVPIEKASVLVAQKIPKPLGARRALAVRKIISVVALIAIVIPILGRNAVS